MLWRLAVALTLAAGAFVSANAVAAGDVSPLHVTFYSDKLQSGVLRAALDIGAPGPNGARLIEDGQPGNPPASSEIFRDTGLSIEAVIAVDASGSMTGRPFDAVKAALHDFVSSTRPQDKIALISFADEVDVRQPFTGDKTLLTRAIDSLEPGGKMTVLNQAIDRGLTLLEAEGQGRRHLLVITDGKNEGAGPAMPVLTKRAKGSGIPVSAIGITRLAPFWLAQMSALAQESGGAYIRVKDYDQLRGAMSEGVDWLMRSPVLTFTLAHVHPDGARHRFRIAVPGHVTETFEIKVPKPYFSGLLLYGVVAAAVVLFIFGMVLIFFGRQKRPSAVAAVAAPSAREAAQPAFHAPAARTRTVLVAPPRPADRPIRPPAKSARNPSPAAHDPVPAVRKTDPSPQPTEFRNVFPEPRAGQPVGWLRVLEGPSAGATHPVDSARIHIGAARGNQITLLQDSTVSSHHASVTWEAGDLYLLDERSTNGTSVNGRKLEPGVRVRLQPGDRISIGRCRLAFEM